MTRATDLRRTTAPALLAEHARTRPGRRRVPLEARGASTASGTWRDYAALVGPRRTAALRALGVAKGERVAIMGDACEEWLVCDLAAQALGAVIYGIYPTASAAEVEYQLRDGGAAIFVAEDQEYVDRVLAVRRPAAGAALDRGDRFEGDVRLRPSEAPATTPTRSTRRLVQRRRGARGA